MYRLFISLVLLSLSTFYDLTSNDLTGNDINFNDFHGKKVLIVNTAMNSKYVNQFSSLEQLYEQYQDSLVIIAYPSNSFNNEPNDDPSDLSYIIRNTYGVSYTLGELTRVTGDGMSDTYQWLTSQNLNGQGSTYVQDDFQKYLIDTSGNLVGVFASNVDPMSTELKNAIDSTY